MQNTSAIKLLSNDTSYIQDQTMTMVLDKQKLKELAQENDDDVKDLQIGTLGNEIEIPESKNPALRLSQLKNMSTEKSITKSKSKKEKKKKNSKTKFQVVNDSQNWEQDEALSQLEQFVFSNQGQGSKDGEQQFELRQSQAKQRLKGKLNNTDNELLRDSSSVQNFEKHGENYDQTKFSKHSDITEPNVDLNSQKKKEVDIFEEVTNSMIITLIEHSLKTHHVDEKLQAQQIFDIMNPQQLKIYKDFVQKALIYQKNSKISPEQQYSSEQLLIDYGGYPLTPWLNKIQDKNKQEQIQYQHTHNCQIPIPSKDLIVIRQGDCSSDFEITDQQLKQSPLFKMQGVDPISVKNSINNINNFLRPVRAKFVRFEKILLLYLFIGLIVTGGLAFIFATCVKFPIVSIILGVLYMAGLIFLLIRTKMLTSNLLLKTHFNLALILKNENERFYSKFGLRVRPGYLSRWLEIHCLFPLEDKQLLS